MILLPSLVGLYIRSEQHNKLTNVHLDNKDTDNKSVRIGKCGHSWITLGLIGKYGRTDVRLDRGRTEMRLDRYGIAT